YTTLFRSVEVLVDLEHGLEQPVGSELGDHVCDADGDAHGPAHGPSGDKVHELAADAEDLFGVAVDDLPHLRQHQAAPGAPEELLANGLFEELDLCADGR